MKVCIVDRTGLWIVVGRWNVAYWAPWVKWVPLSMRNRRHWWGAFRVDRLAAKP